MYKVLLFYKFAKIENPTMFCEEHIRFCKDNDLLGRIIISHEGINATVGGLPDNIDAYKKYLSSKKGFEDTWFKEQESSHNPFPKLQCRTRIELITLGAGSLDISETAKHMSPIELNEAIEKNEVIILDTRNEIESRIGRFKDAITIDIKNFREFPEALSKLSDLKDKKIVTYCTGGVRCEKATILMKKLGFNEVYQLDGGIYNYCNQFPDGYFEGTCYIFDDRIQVGWAGDATPKLLDDFPLSKVISFCEFCNSKTARVVNDERFLERVQRVCCEDCDRKNDISRMRSPEERKAMTYNRISSDVDNFNKSSQSI